MILSVIVTNFITRISGAWEFILECGAGLGLVLILRWFWWRINAWSEIIAMITPFLVLPFLRMANIQFPISLFYLVAVNTIVWLTVTYLTKPTDEKILISFYEKIHPGGILWKPISNKLPNVKSDTGFLRMFINWIAGVILVYSMLFGIGEFIFGNLTGGIIYTTISILSIIIIYRNLSKIGWESYIT